MGYGPFQVGKNSRKINLIKALALSVIGIKGYTYTHPIISDKYFDRSSKAKRFDIVEEKGELRRFLNGLFLASFPENWKLFSKLTK